MRNTGSSFLINFAKGSNYLARETIFKLPPLQGIYFPCLYWLRKVLQQCLQVEPVAHLAISCVAFASLYPTSQSGEYQSSTHLQTVLAAGLHAVNQSLTQTVKQDKDNLYKGNHKINEKQIKI